MGAGGGLGVGVGGVPLSVFRVFSKFPGRISSGRSSMLHLDRTRSPLNQGTSRTQAVRRRVWETWGRGYVLEEKGETSRWAWAAGAGRG